MNVKYATEKQTKILDKIHACQMNICILEDKLYFKDKDGNIKNKPGFPEDRKRTQDLLYSNKKKLNKYIELMNKSMLKGEGVEIENENRPE